MLTRSITSVKGAVEQQFASETPMASDEVGKKEEEQAGVKLN